MLFHRDASMYLFKLLSMNFVNWSQTYLCPALTKATSFAVWFFVLLSTFYTLSVSSVCLSMFMSGVIRKTFSFDQIRFVLHFHVTCINCFILLFLRCERNLRPSLSMWCDPYNRTVVLLQLSLQVCAPPPTGCLKSHNRVSRRITWV